tara:strand:- start:1587 stop:2825 length:1239 start_codon:yes stop_codon:yes gene_type:complete
MDSSELALLLGLMGGGLGGYFGGKRRDERERAQKKEDREELAKFERELAAQLREDARIEAETAKFKEEGRFTEGDRRGELKNPNSLYNFLFNPSESDPIHEMLGGGRLADALVGTTAYDDPNIRNQQREDFVANPEDNFLTTTGALGLASLLVPGMGLLRGANIASKFMPASMAGLGPRMMGGLRNYFSRPTGTAPSVPAMAYGGMNQGGRVGYAEGTLEQGVQAEPGFLESIFGEKITDTIQRGYLDLVGGGKDSISMSEWDNLYNQLIQSGESHEEALMTLGERPTLIGKADGGRVGLSQGTDERGVMDRAVDVGADFITRLRRGVVSPEDYDPGFTEYVNPFDFIGTMNEAIGLQRLLMGPDQQADQRVLNILGDLNPNYDPSVVGTGDILDPLLMQMYGLPQDTRGLD